jgi:hypothetical protein
VRRTIAPADFEADLGAWRGGALGLAHTLAQSAVFRPRNASRKVGGLFYAGTSVLPGIGLPMCLISAELVVKRLRGDDGAARLPEPSGVGAGRASAPAETTPEMPGAYLLILLVSLGGIIVLDARLRLVLWSAANVRPTRARAIAAVLVGTVFFLPGMPSASPPACSSRVTAPIFWGSTWPRTFRSKSRSSSPSCAIWRSSCTLP